MPARRDSLHLRGLKSEKVAFPLLGKPNSIGIWKMHFLRKTDSFAVGQVSRNIPMLHGAFLSQHANISRIYLFSEALLKYSACSCDAPE